MAQGNFFVNMGYISFGQLSSPFFYGGSFNYYNFSMPNFYSQCLFNYNQPFTFFQNTYAQPFFNSSYNFSYNIQPFKSDYIYNYTPNNSFHLTSPTFSSNTYSTTSTKKTTNNTSKTLDIKSNTPTSTSRSTIFRDYNEDSGKRLAKKALQNAGFVIDDSTKVTSKKKNPDKFTSYCTRYVKAAIRDSGLGEYYNAGSAYQMTSYLRNNDNFKEISSSTPLKDVPAGCILVYDRGVGGYSSEHGHIEIKTEDGRAVSDGITDNLYKRPSHIFMPV